MGGATGTGGSTASGPYPSTACVDRANTLLGQMTADELTKYKSDVQPFLVPLQAFAASSSVGKDLDTVTTVVTVK